MTSGWRLLGDCCYVYRGDLWWREWYELRLSLTCWVYWSDLEGFWGTGDECWLSLPESWLFCLRCEQVCEEGSLAGLCLRL